LFATVVTLLVVPASYTIFEDIKGLFKGGSSEADDVSPPLVVDRVVD
jgi:hypothetical protein